MKRVNLKKLSIMGVTLLAASAVVAAIVPGSKKANLAVNGVLQAQGNGTADTHTCVAAEDGLNCHNTATAGQNGTSSGGGSNSTTATVGNTTTGDAS